MTICHWISYFKSSLFFILTIDKDQTKLYSAWPIGGFNLVIRNQFYIWS